MRAGTSSGCCTASRLLLLDCGADCPMQHFCFNLEARPACVRVRAQDATLQTESLCLTGNLCLPGGGLTFASCMRACASCSGLQVIEAPGLAGDQLCMQHVWRGLLKVPRCLLSSRMHGGGALQHAWCWHGNGLFCLLIASLHLASAVHSRELATQDRNKLTSAPRRPP